MTVLKKIAYYQKRRDEVPNQELARELAEEKDAEGVREIVEHLHDRNPQIQADCVKVLYEIGALDPQLIAEYWEEFLALLGHKNNRMVWGGMSALAAIATLKARELGPHAAELKRAMDAGSVITVDNAVKALADIAAAAPEFSPAIFPYLLDHLRTCRIKEVPQHSEKILPAVTAANKAEWIALLQKRMERMTVPQAARVKKVIKAAEKR